MAEGDLGRVEIKRSQGRWQSVGMKWYWETGNMGFCFHPTISVLTADIKRFNSDSYLEDRVRGKAEKI